LLCFAAIFSDAVFSLMTRQTGRKGAEPSGDVFGVNGGNQILVHLGAASVW
jgi:hypothetical protein